MTFEPTPTMIEAVSERLRYVDVVGSRTVAEIAIKELFRHLQNNPDDARVFAEGFMETWTVNPDTPKEVVAYRLPEVQS